MFPSPCVIIMLYINQLTDHIFQGVFYAFVLNCSTLFGVIFTIIRSTHSLKLSMVFCLLQATLYTSLVVNHINLKSQNNHCHHLFTKNSKIKIKIKIRIHVTLSVCFWCASPLVFWDDILLVVATSSPSKALWWYIHKHVWCWSLHLMCKSYKIKRAIQLISLRYRTIIMGFSIHLKTNRSNLNLVVSLTPRNKELIDNLQVGHLASHTKCTHITTNSVCSVL
jgi:hypothetical protein